MSGAALSTKYIAQNATAYWRHSNLSYLQYLSISSNLLRNVLKEDLRVKAIPRAELNYVNILVGGEKGKLFIARENCFFLNFIYLLCTNFFELHFVVICVFLLLFSSYLVFAP